MKNYIKKNKFFIVLLILLIGISLSLGVYIIQKDTVKKKPTSNNQPIVDNGTDTTTKEAEINGFDSKYDRRTNQISVSWQYSSNASQIESVNLYLNNNYVANVSSVSYYNLVQNVYNFPTGNNIITLELILSDGKSIKKESNVFVDYILSAKQVVSQSDSATKVTLEYVYDKNQPVEIPKILFISGDIITNPIINYVTTEYKESGNLMTASCTYEFIWGETPVEYQTFGVRWKFADIQDSFDFQAVKGTKKAD